MCLSWLMGALTESLIIRKSIEAIYISSVNLVQKFLKYHSISQCTNVVNVSTLCTKGRF
jgi:hypothetical protein